jgi:hypothetical protein
VISVIMASIALPYPPVRVFLDYLDEELSSKIGTMNRSSRAC